MSTSIKALIAHLHFDGRAAEAIALYERALDAKVLARMHWKDMPSGDISAAEADRVMHARLAIGGGTLLLADRAGKAPETPSNGTIMIELEDAAELDRRFELLTQGGKAQMPPHDAFWGARFAIAVDAVGVQWMLHAAKPPA